MRPPPSRHGHAYTDSKSVLIIGTSWFRECVNMIRRSFTTINE